jgi:hypothetical protein
VYVDVYLNKKGSVKWVNLIILFVYCRLTRGYIHKKKTMSERDYLPLSATLVKTLTDKLYEKRKTAALEIEK